MDLDKLMSKHLTRYFDPSRTIPDETLRQLLRFLRSTPTSTNVQPNHFYVIATPEGKKQLADGRFPEPAKQELWESMTRDFLDLRNFAYKDVNHWMEKQTYMAVGLTMIAAAELGVEAMPLEGFDPATVDKAFKIRETGHATTVLLALGYPDPSKQYSNPISRFDTDELFTFV
ncbi:nitroreductase family protein [Kribbella sp. NPDC051620]|uniref:nitroreductase family protein n=1 Tax=Kribbella sp. NPDC051620 TaxID=3364120 RepID=UPI0037BA794D